MADLRSLSNSRVNRKVREVVENGDDTIIIYEPSIDDVEKIIEIQDIIMGEAIGAEAEIIITGVDMVKKVFPLLTNIDGISEMTDDEIEYTISNPTIALLQVQHVVEIIITQIYKTVILSTRKRMLDADFDASSLSMVQSVVDKVSALEAANSIESAELYSQVQEKTDNVVNMLDFAGAAAEELDKIVAGEQQESTEEEIKPDFTSSPTDKYNSMLSNYQDGFKK